MSSAIATQPIVIGDSLAALLGQIADANSAPSQRRRDDARSTQQLPSLVSLKYNFKPESLADCDRGILHNPAQNPSSEWHLELDASHAQPPAADTPSTSRAGHVFTGPQHPAKGLDCVLVWDSNKHAYVLDRLASTLTLKFERSKTTLSDPAFAALSGKATGRKQKRRSADVEDLERGLVPSASAAQDRGRDRTAASAVQRASSRLSSVTRISSPAASSVDASPMSAVARSGRTAQEQSSRSPAPALRALISSTSGRPIPVGVEVEEFTDSPPPSATSVSTSRQKQGTRARTTTEAEGGRIERSSAGNDRMSPLRRMRSDSIRGERDEPSAVKRRRPESPSLMEAERPPSPHHISEGPQRPFDATRNFSTSASEARQKATESTEARPPAEETGTGDEAARANANDGEDFEDDLAQVLELDLERELDRLSNDEEGRPPSASPSLPSPSAPSQEQETTAASVGADPPRSSAVDHGRFDSGVMGSPVVACFKLRRNPGQRGASEDSLKATDPIELPTTPAVQTPFEELTRSPEPGPHAAGAASTLASPSLARPDVGSPMGLGLQTLDPAIPPAGSPLVDHARHDTIVRHSTSSVEATKDKSNASAATTEPATIVTGWKPKPAAERQVYGVPEEEDSAGDEDADDDDEDEDDDEDDEDDDEDDDDDGLDDFAAELHLTLADDAAPSDPVEAPQPPASSSSPYSTGAQRRASKAPATSAIARGQTRPSSTTAAAAAAAAGRKVYGLGGPREEEDDLEDSD